MTMGATFYEEIDLGWVVKPCPFCGRQPKVYAITNYEEVTFSIRFSCKKCRISKTQTANFYGKQSWDVEPSVTELALKKWNKRVGEQNDK